MTKKTIQASDFMSLTSRHVTDEGYLVAPGNLARTGVQDYRAYELGLDADGMDPMKVIRLHRPPEEVFDAASMASFENKPITIEHPPVAVTADNWADFAKGEVRDVGRSGDLMTGTLVIRSKDAIEAVQSGKAQLSNGYTFELDMTPGTTADGRAYDGVQRNIRGNHVALVDAARCGSACRIVDSDEGNWVTIKGTHVLLGEGGEVLSHNSGNLAGKSFPNAKSTTSKGSGSESNAPKIPEGHHALQTPLKIERETEKAFGVATPGYHEARATARYDLKELSSTQLEMLRNGSSLTWLPKSHSSAHEGYVVSTSPWLASKHGLATKEGAAAREKAFAAGKERYSKLLETAKAAGVKGVRERMKTSTIKEKMRAHGLKVDSLDMDSTEDEAIDYMVSAFDSGMRYDDAYFLTDEGEKKMVIRRVTVDGIPLEVEDTAAEVIDTLIKQRNEARDALTPLKTKAAEADGLKVALDKAHADIEALKKDVVTPEARDAMVAEWAKLIGDAKRLVPELTTDGKTCLAIRREVVATLAGKDATAKAVSDAVLAGKDVQTADAEVVRATFNALAAAIKAEANDADVAVNDAAVADALTGDGKGAETKTGLTGRDKFLARQSQAWQQ
jgi:hypothetical protein